MVDLCVFAGMGHGHDGGRVYPLSVAWNRVWRPRQL